MTFHPNLVVVVAKYRVFIQSLGGHLPHLTVHLLGGLDESEVVIVKKG